MAGPPNPPPGPRRNIRTISYVTDSIGGNVMIDELEKITKTKFKKKRAYGAVKALGQTYPVSNFTDVVPKEMAENKPDVLVLQRDSVTLTDLSEGAPEEYARQQMKVVSQNMMTVATSALASNPQLQQVIIMQAAPRYDDKEDLNNYGNDMLHEAKKESLSVHKNKVFVGVHNLECTDAGMKASRYGDGSKGQVDMVHMRGSSGLVSYTRSVAQILAAAGLTSQLEAANLARNKEDLKIKNSGGNSFQNQGRNRSGGNNFQNQGRQNKGGSRRQQQPSIFELATSNMFAPLQSNC